MKRRLTLHPIPESPWVCSIAISANVERRSEGGIVLPNMAEFAPEMRCISCKGGGCAKCDYSGHCEMSGNPYLTYHFMVACTSHPGVPLGAVWSCNSAFRTLRPAYPNVLLREPGYAFGVEGHEFILRVGAREFDMSRATGLMFCHADCIEAVRLVDDVGVVPEREALRDVHPRIKATGSHVVVQRGGVRENQTVRESGLVLPQNSHSRPMIATVLSAGERTHVRAGSRVVLAPMRTATLCEEVGDDQLVLHEASILCEVSEHGPEGRSDRLAA